MIVHLVDGTYELFRHFYGLRRFTKGKDPPFGAVIGVLQTVLQMLEKGATHVGVATDHIIESFRNDLWADYKTSEGIEPALWAQFHPLEEALVAMGVVVWPMVELEADDALASAAASLSKLSEVERVYICSPDKDLAQCVVKNRVVMLDRRRKTVLDEKGIIERFGVPPASIPDYLALVGDTADGYPGLSGWGEKSASAVLNRYGHLEAIPRDISDWKVSPRRAERLVSVLRENLKLAFLFRNLATLRKSEPAIASAGELVWRGPHESFVEMCHRLDGTQLIDRVTSITRSS